MGYTGSTMLFTGLGWKEIPAIPEYSEWTDFDPPKKILKGITVTTSTGPVYGASIPWPTWANNSLVSPSLFSEPAPPPPKKPDPEPMDLTSKRRINLNE